MNRFDRHIIWRLSAGFVVLVAILIVFFIVLHYVEFVDDFYDRGATMRDVFLVYYPSYIPEILKLISPLGIFLACVYLTGRLTQSLQLTALQTSGVSLYRLMVPYLAVATMLTGFMFWFNGWIVPETNRTVLAFEQQYLKDAPKVIDIADIHRQNRPGTFVTVGYFDRRTETAYNVSIHRFSNAEELEQRIDSPRMEWLDSLSVWRLHEPVVRQFQDHEERRMRRARIDTTLQILPRDLARTEREVESMTIPAARQYIADLERSGAGGIGRTQVGYYSKFAYPFANLILVLIGMPLAAVRRRGGQAVQIGLGLVVAFAYLVLQKVTEPFGYAGTISPLLVAWLPHVAFLAVGIILLYRVRK